MIAQFYAISFSSALISLICWYIFSDNKGLSRLFGGLFTISVVGYVLSSYAGTMSAGDRLFQLFRDIAVVAVSGWLSGMLRSEKPYKAIAIIAALLFLYFFYFQYIKTQYIANSQQVNVLLDSGLDPGSELLLEMKNGSPRASIDPVLKKYGLTARIAFEPGNGSITDLDDYLAIDIPSTQLDQISAIIRDLEATGAVDWIEENEVIRLEPEQSSGGAIQPSRKDFGLNDPGISRQWGLEAMGSDQLYSWLRSGEVTPQKKALIAILDTGVDARHEDISANFRSIQSKSDTDRNKHGTHCAGIAAAVCNNGKGIASFSSDPAWTQVTSVKVLSDAGSGSQESIIDGILFAADQGADVLSLSLGGPSTRSAQRAYELAVQYANRKGAIVVVAAGNSNADARRHAPANAPGVIAVSAIDNTLKKSSFSNDVSGLLMGIAAPGSDIYSTLPGNTYGSLNGTSMATPYVAGLLGLMKSIRPELTTAEAYEILKTTGKNTPSGNRTGPLIQPGQALQQMGLSFK